MTTTIKNTLTDIEMGETTTGTPIKPTKRNRKTILISSVVLLFLAFLSYLFYVQTTKTYPNVILKKESTLAYYLIPSSSCEDILLSYYSKDDKDHRKALEKRYDIKKMKNAFNKEWSPVEAIDEGCLLAVKIFYREGKIGPKSFDKYGMRYLQYASLKGRLDVVEFLVGKGFNKDAKDDFGKSPLHYAAEYGKLDVVKFLVGKGCEKNEKDQFGSTPLHLAVLHGELNVVEFLIENGCNKEAKDKDGMTLLHLAAVKGHSDVVEYLIKEGCDKEARDEDGRTPIYYASGKPELLEAFEVEQNE